MKSNSDIKEDIVIIDGNFELFKKSLDQKKVVLAAIELGKKVQDSLDTGWSDLLKVHTKLKELTNEGVCFCGKKATHLVYYWK